MFSQAWGRLGLAQDPVALTLVLKLTIDGKLNYGVWHVRGLLTTKPLLQSTVSQIYDFNPE